jgi:predicted ATPase
MMGLAGASIQTWFWRPAHEPAVQPGHSDAKFATLPKTTDYLAAGSRLRYSPIASDLNNLQMHPPTVSPSLTNFGKPARITYLRVENFRALRKVEFKNLTPLTVLLGPNGSGKSTVFDVFAFLSECFESGLRRAWDRRGRAKELKTRGSDGPTVIELKCKEQGYPLITYHLAVDERGGVPVVVEEWLAWKRGSHGRPFRFLDYREGKGRAASGEAPDIDDRRIEIPLKSPDLIAVNALGQFADHPRVAALRDFITGWYVSYFSVDNTRGQPEAGPQERLSRTGDNLANVIQYLSEQHPARLANIFDVLRSRVPRIESVLAEPMADGRLLLTIKDAPFSNPILARFASDGTLKMLAYLVMLYDPLPPPFIGIEEPENFLHPRLLYGLAEECRAAAERSQLLVTTHSPFFLNGIRPEEVRVLYRDDDGYTQVSLASDIQGVSDFMDEGALLGHLWAEGHFGVGDPLTNQGSPSHRIKTVK